MPAGLIKNKAGNFIEPSLQSVSAAANVDLPDDTRVSITNTDAADGYPISGFTWLILMTGWFRREITPSFPVY